MWVYGFLSEVNKKIMLNKLWNIEEFLDKVFKNLENDWVNVQDYELDHICYRVDSLEKYDFWKKEISKCWILLSEVVISGRNISTFKLKNPYIYKGREISVLEIPSPKSGSSYNDWFEHVEFVIVESFDNFMAKYSNLKFITKALSKRINPDIKRKYNDCSVKFHYHSLEYIIKNFEQ